MIPMRLSHWKTMEEEEGMGGSFCFVCFLLIFVSSAKKTERWENWKQGRIDFDGFLNYYYGMNKKKIGSYNL